MIRITFILLAIIFVTSACDKNSDQSGVYQSEKSSFYNGKAWNWVQLDAGGNPVQAAIVLDDAAVNSLPIGGTNNPLELSTKFSAQSSTLPFAHTYISWNPNGTIRCLSTANHISTSIST